MAMSKVVCAAAAVFCCLRGGAALSRSSRVGSALEADKNRPVTKVITLLKDMQKQLQREGEEDEEIFSKMACWCQDNDREKTKSIAQAETRIEELTHNIEEYTGLSAQLNTELKNHKKEVAEHQAALEKATALRGKQLAEFNAEEKDLLESISALKSAVTVLSKHQSLAQLSSSNVATVLHRALPRAARFLSQEQNRVATSLLQAGDHFEAVPAFRQSYAPQSGEIFGILSQMKETFEANLASSQKEEQENQQAYEDLKAAKQEEIASGQAQIDSKTQELADTDEKNAQAKEDVHDTKNSLSADEEFLMMLKEKCSMTDKEWESRQKTRQEEIGAVSKALEILSGDDAHDLYTRTFNPALVQVGVSRNRREAAARLLQNVAKRVGAPQLSTLAMRVKLDAFERVKSAIDEMVQELLKEKQDEIKHRDFCVKEFNTNEMQADKMAREQKDSQAMIVDLKMQVKDLAQAIDALKAEIAEMQVQLKRAGEDRQKENKDFQATVTDQRATQRLLKMALDVLQGVYGEEKAALMQQEPAGPPPPAGFGAYKKNESSGGVMGMLEQIAADAKAMESEAVRAEEDSQKGYEDFVKETNASIEAKSREIVNKSQEKAKDEQALVQEEKTLESLNLELEQLSNYKGQLHESCDFVMRNFDVRQQARDEEVEALRQAKSILSGAKFE